MKPKTEHRTSFVCGDNKGQVLGMETLFCPRFVLLFYCSVTNQKWKNPRFGNRMEFFCSHLKFIWKDSRVVFWRSVDDNDDDCKNNENSGKGVFRWVFVSKRQAFSRSKPLWNNKTWQWKVIQYVVHNCLKITWYFK